MDCPEFLKYTAGGSELRAVGINRSKSRGRSDFSRSVSKVRTGALAKRLPTIPVAGETGCRAVRRRRPAAQLPLNSDAVRACRRSVRRVRTQRQAARPAPRQSRVAKPVAAGHCHSVAAIVSAAADCWPARYITRSRSIRPAGRAVPTGAVPTRPVHRMVDRSASLFSLSRKAARPV